MAEFKHAVVLAALMFIYRPSIGEKPAGGPCECTTVSALIVLTAAFAFLAAADLALPFSCRLPCALHFLYELLVSLFVFEVVARWFWDRFECLVTGRLPAAVDRALDGQCCLFGLLCPTSGLGAHLFVAIVYLVALALLCTVLYGFGVLTATVPFAAPRLPSAIPLACRRCLRALKGQC